MTDVSFETYARAHIDGLLALVAGESWTEYTEDAERTHDALSTPGVKTLLSLVGAIRIQSGGVIQAHVSMLLIDPEWRGRQLATRLLLEGPRPCRRPAGRHPYPERGLLRAPRREPLARISAHARGPRARGYGRRPDPTRAVAAGIVSVRARAPRPLAIPQEQPSSRPTCSMSRRATSSRANSVVAPRFRCAAMRCGCGPAGGRAESRAWRLRSLAVMTFDPPFAGVALHPYRRCLGSARTRTSRLCPGTCAPPSRASTTTR